MTSVIHKTVETEVRRASFALLLCDGSEAGRGGAIIVEYVLSELFTETLQHREAFVRGMKVLAARGLNPAACVFVVMRHVEDTPAKHSWWEMAEAFDFSAATDVAAGVTRVKLLKTEEPMAAGSPPPAEHRAACEQPVDPGRAWEVEGWHWRAAAELARVGYIRRKNLRAVANLLTTVLVEIATKGGAGDVRDCEESAVDQGG